MPPRKKQSSPKVKKEEVERRKRVLLAQEKVLATKRLLLSIVENMIEKSVSKKWFLENCVKLCQHDYDDVVEERRIENICGYPLCSNTIKETLKQKYQISLATNKVYDLTERKSYCSNQCYKASKYLKTQLSPIPLYMRKEEEIKIHLLSDCDNRGSAGEEIVFLQKLTKEEIEKNYSVENFSNNMHKMLKDEIKNCADSLNNLQIKEHVFDTQFVFGNETPKKPENSLSEEKSESDSENDVDSEEDDDDDDEKLFPNYDNTEVLSEKHMPVPKNIKKSVLIPPLEDKASRSAVTAPLSIDFVYKVLNDWLSESTMKYLFGEKYIYGLKADHILQRMTGTEPICSEKLQSLKEEYINLSLKIDSLLCDDDDEEDEEDDFNDYVELGVTPEAKPNPMSETLENSAEKKVFKRRPKDKSKAKDKCVSFAPKVESSDQTSADLNDLESVTVVAEDEVSEESASKGPLSEPAFPLVDSVAQNVLRRQIVISHLKSVYTDLLPVIGIHYTDIREAVRKFVDTLSLTPKNVIFKPKEWRLISLTLYRILTKTVMKKFLNELQFLRLIEDMSLNIDVIKLEKIVSDILSPDNIIRIK